MTLLFGYQNCSFSWPGSAPGDLFERTRAAAQRAEAAGFSSFWLMDHLVQIPLFGTLDEPLLEAWTTLAGLAAVTSRIRLGTLVTATSYRNPALLAKMAATVDVISGGRVILGIGAGWFRTEYAQYGFTFPEKPSTRIAQLNEAVQVIKTLWTQPRARFEGKYFQVQDAILEPKPLQKPHPPILIGGGGEKLTLRVAARHANAVNWFGNPAVIHHKRAVLARHCAAVGRDVDEITITSLEDVIVARQEAGVRHKRGQYHLGDRASLIGTVTQIIDQIAELHAAGVRHLIVNIPHNDPETFDLLASDVLPAFR